MNARRPVSCALLLVAALCAPLAAAQTLLDFDLWMQQIDRHSQSVLRNIDRRDSAAGVLDARQLQDLYQRMENFYQGRGDADDAVLASYVGKDHARELVQALEDRHFERASREAIAIARDCNHCHTQFKPMRN